MAARPITDEEFRKALDMYCVASGITASEGEDHGQKRFLLSPGDITVRLEDGKIVTTSQSTYEKISELVMEMRQTEPASVPKSKDRPVRGMNTPVIPRKPVCGPTAMQDMPIRDIQVAELTMADIKEYLCPKATDSEAFMFLKLCQSRGLNPFIKEAYLIKYSDSKPATMVVGKEHFTKTAEKNQQFDGMTAGIIIQVGENMERRLGTFMKEGEALLGGWASVKRKDRSLLFEAEVSLRTFLKKSQSGQTPWDTMPEVMIRKVALVQALREAFPNDLAGCYDRSEMDQAIEPDYVVR